MGRVVALFLLVVIALGGALSASASLAYAATATHLAITIAPPANVQSGNLFNVQVEARDAGGIDPTFTGNVTLNAAAVGGSDFTAGNTIAAVAGVANFSVFLNNAADLYTVTASAAGLTSHVSSVFNVTANHLAFPAAISSVRAGDAFNLTVQARDANNNRAENFNNNIDVNAAATGGSNFDGGTQTLTAVDGVATFNSLVLSNAADGYVATATAAGLTGGASNAFNVTAHHLTITTVVPNMQAGTVFGVNVQARDNNNNLAENFIGSVNLNAAAVGGSNFVGGTANATATAGIATFSGLVLNDAANGYQITASAIGTNSGFSNAFNVTAAIHLAFTVAPPAAVRSGDLFSVQVEARDADGNIDLGFTGSVNLDAAATGGSNFDGGTQTATAVAGVASFNVLLSNAADGYVATASSTGLVAATSNAFNVTAHHLTITTVVPNMQAGTVFGVNVQARDNNNNLAENFIGSVNLNAAAVGGSNFVGGTANATATAGIATFSGLVLNDAANGYQITASAIGTNSGFSNAFNVTATHLAVLAVANVRSGDAFNVSVQARDANNVVAENFTGNVNLDAAATGGSNFNGGTANVAAGAGTASAVGLVLDNAADGYTITAASAGLTNGVSNSFNVTARHLTITSVVANMQAGTIFGVNVEARDGNNAMAENFNSNVDLSAAATGGSNFNGGTVNAVATAGIATFSDLALNNAADNYMITASATGLINGLSNSFNVTATHLAVLAVANVRAGDAFNVTVQARDADNNGAENFTGNVSLNAAATGGSNFNGGTANVAAAAGITSAVGLVLNDAADGYTITASSTGLTSGVSNSFNVVAGTLVITSVVANMQAGTTFSVSVEARDASNAVAENFNSHVDLNAAAVGGSTFVGGTKTQSAVAGSATFSSLALNNAADSYMITASTSGLINAVSNAFNVTATHLAALAIANVRSGDAFNVTVQARDADNNVAENFTGNVSVNAAATGGSNFNGGTANVGAVAGMASAVGLVLNDAADGYTITASSVGLTSGVSNSFNVTARTLVIVTVVPQIEEETNFSVTVEARDANNAVAENFTGIVSLNAAAPGGSNFTGGTKTRSALAGVATFSALQLDVPANGYILTASASGLISGLSNAFNVIPLTAEDRIDRLVLYIESLGLEHPVEDVLTNTLQKELDALSDGKTHNACVRADTFEHQVGGFNSAGKITNAQATELIARIDQIRTLVGCLP